MHSITIQHLNVYFSSLFPVRFVCQRPPDAARPDEPASLMFRFLIRIADDTMETDVLVFDKVRTRSSVTIPASLVHIFEVKVLINPTHYSFKCKLPMIYVPIFY